MQSLSSFFTNKKFYAKDHFPYGLSRCGEFNQDQAKLLEEYGSAYRELHLGERQPVNDEERNFVLVCNGERLPKTKHEMVWIYYCHKIKERNTGESFSGKPQLQDFGTTVSSDDEEW
ncbi:DUF413 domain-containing protein [Agarilytica rhodophyticola]|uniref:DUF413 domain-containing protein n=1 Tax=Agarilytica rhodophyticola TaxID=1737490 RepID=UPI000B34424A|nr:DUF413 domain-containing protein [Agarilytica rhodophyticola]